MAWSESLSRSCWCLTLMVATSFLRLSAVVLEQPIAQNSHIIHYQWYDQGGSLHNDSEWELKRQRSMYFQSLMEFLYPEIFGPSLPAGGGWHQWQYRKVRKAADHPKKKQSPRRSPPLTTRKDRNTSPDSLSAFSETTDSQSPASSQSDGEKKLLSDSEFCEQYQPKPAQFQLYSLPQDILNIIFSLLTLKDQQALRSTCRPLHASYENVPAGFILRKLPSQYFNPEVASELRQNDYLSETSVSQRQKLLRRAQVPERLIAKSSALPLYYLALLRYLSERKILTPQFHCLLYGHNDSVRALAMLPGGRLASASDDYTVRIWNIETGICEIILRGHSSLVCDLAVLADGRLASASDDYTVRVWDMVTKECVTILQDFSNQILAIAVLPDSRLAVACGDMVDLWNTATEICEDELQGHTGWVWALAVLADGRLASASDDSTARLWNTETLDCEFVLQGHRQWVRALAVLPRERLASAGDDKVVKIWDTVTGLCIASLAGHSSSIWVLAVLPDGRLISASDDTFMRIWNVEAQSCEAILDNYWVRALAVTPDGNLLISADQDIIKMWSIYRLANGLQ